MNVNICNIYMNMDSVPLTAILLLVNAALFVGPRVRPIFEPVIRYCKFSPVGQDKTLAQGISGLADLPSSGY